MPTPTYVPIAKNLLTTNQSSISFSGISTQFTDLVVVASVRSTASAKYDALLMQINSLTADNTYTEIFGYSTGTLSARNQNGASKQLVGWMSGATTTTSTFGIVEIYVANYQSSTQKTFQFTSISEDNATTADSSYPAAIAGFLNNTAAISSLTFNLSTGNISSGSRFDLYGIKNS